MNYEPTRINTPIEPEMIILAVLGGMSLIFMFLIFTISAGVI